MAASILLVEDDLFLQQGLREMLAREGYVSSVAGTVAAARRMLPERAYQLVILDVSLPDGDGVSLCREWRGEGVQTPILFLTARDEEVAVVRGLDAGGNDYVTKPFRMQELLSRIRALLRASVPTLLQKGRLVIDQTRMQVTKDGEALYLTPTEYRILVTLVSRDGGVVTRDALLARIWDDGGKFVDDNTLSVHVSRLREKIGAQHVRTARGVGYQWQD